MRILVFVLKELSPVEHNRDNYNLLGVLKSTDIIMVVWEHRGQPWKVSSQG